MGRTVWKKWKRRYFVLVQVSQYTFAICSYKEKKADPSAMMQLDGYTVDYIEPAGGNYTNFSILYQNQKGAKIQEKMPKNWILGIHSATLSSYTIVFYNTSFLLYSSHVFPHE